MDERFLNALELRLDTQTRLLAAIARLQGSAVALLMSVALKAGAPQENLIELSETVVSILQDVNRIKEGLR